MTDSRDNNPKKAAPTGRRPQGGPGGKDAPRAPRSSGAPRASDTPRTPRASDTPRAKASPGNKFVAGGRSGSQTPGRPAQKPGPKPSLKQGGTTGPQSQQFGSSRTPQRLTPQQREAERERERSRKEREQRRNLKPIGFAAPGSRIKVMSIAVLVLFLAFGGRLAHIQLVQGETLAAEALSLRTTHIKLAAQRGEILDRNGNLVAKSTTRYNIFADQELLAAWKSVDKDGNQVGGPRHAAKLLAPVLELDENELAAQLTKAADAEKYNKYLVLVRDVPPEMWNAVKELKISGMFPETFNKRIYPAGNTGANIIGIAGKDAGLSGLEYSLDDELTGTDGTLTFEQGGKGQIIPVGQIEENLAVPGEQISITLDMDLQWHAEEALRSQISDMGASSGYVIVQDVKTCEVLALASEEASSADAGVEVTGRVGAVQDIFEPGSTAKIVTMAAVLETTDLTPTSEFTVNDRYTTPNGETFRDSHDHGPEKLTLAGILSESSNTGTVMLGEKIPKQVRHDYLSKFGFGKTTGIELGGESRGILANAKDWDGRTEYAVLFGQGLAGNALQTTNVFATVANGGNQCQPHLVSGTTDSQGTFIPSEKSKASRVIEEQTADEIMKMMASVVVEGSGRAGAIQGYNVGGKTGTAQAPDETGAMNSFVASFIGVAPVEDPQIVVSVVIRDPKADIYGGTVAAPVFADVMAYALQQLGVEPTDAKVDLFPTKWGQDSDE